METMNEESLRDHIVNFNQVELANRVSQLETALIIMKSRIEDMKSMNPNHQLPPPSTPLQPLHTVLLFHSRAAVEETLRRRSSSSSSSAPPPSSPSKQKRYHHHDEESKAVRVLVWWDFENCSIPSDVNPSLVGPRIMSALRSNGVRGPVSITAVGDVLRLARQTQDALSATGVSISHIPSEDIWVVGRWMRRQVSAGIVRRGPDLCGQDAID
ncbi:hypothetical protein QJS10_CPB13g01380 [Acorus calamus]|uniref:NYN domain-containing protein n=1 Tax=Acorus calamus TaxID=4465 RepID=A0AAV9DFA3_ACOCL|nr:hypothetical protein QJS10_CPB13g01380 [Acorus calamus]